jgi:EAL domain-containing protein (putative c-di-GMP-specific phosphodiesterase class I)/putative methionine-R-sulfoxide reductase with GAF domain
MSRCERAAQEVHEVPDIFGSFAVATSMRSPVRHPELPLAGRRFKYFSHPADTRMKDRSAYVARSARSIRSTRFSSEEIEVRLTGLRETIISASDPATMMDRVLAGALVLVPSADGAVIGLCANKEFLVFAAASGKLADSVGSVLSLESSLCGVAIKSGITQRCQYAPSDQRVDVVRAAEMGILSLICVPLSRGTDRVGVLILASNKASAFDATDELSLAGLAHFVSSVIDAAMELDLCITELVGPHSEATEALGQGHLAGSTRKAEDRSTFVANVVCPEAALNSATRERIERTLTGDGFSIVLQPIFSLLTGRVVGCEALSRFEGCPQREPDYWFAEASSVGLGSAVELFAIERALSLLPDMPEPLRMGINAGPATFGSPELLALLSASTPSRIIVELTEHVGIEDYPRLRRASKALRRIGCRVALDDTGTGFASLSLLLEVAPELIKLDRAMTRDIDSDPVRRALARALVAFGKEVGAEVVAEGIETAAELDVLVDLGIGYGQGFHLARPGSLNDLNALFLAGDSLQCAAI